MLERAVNPNYSGSVNSHYPSQVSDLLLNFLTFSGYSVHRISRNVVSGCCTDVHHGRTTPHLHRENDLSEMMETALGFVTEQ